MLTTLDPQTTRSSAGDWHLEFDGLKYVVIHPVFGPLAGFPERRDALAYAYRAQAADRIESMMMS